MRSRTVLGRLLAIASLCFAVLAWAEPEARDQDLPEEVAGEKYLLLQFKSDHPGHQVDGAYIVCLIDAELTQAMMEGIQKVNDILGGGQIQYDVKVLSLSGDRIQICLKGTHNQKKEGPLPGRQGGPLDLASTEKLRLNDSERHYRIQKPRDQGERDLYDLCWSTDREENFIFTEYQDGTPEWSECGFNETPETVSLDLRVLPSLLRSSSPLTRLSFYHHHPVSREQNNDTSQTPSQRDVEGFFHIYRYLLANHQEVAPLVDFRVVTSSGVYLFTLDPVLAGGERAELQVSAIAAAIEKERRSTDGFLVGNLASFPKASRRFAAKMSTKLLRIQFVPNRYADTAGKLRGTDAKKTGIYIRDTDNVRYAVFYNRDLDRIILKHPVEPVLYDLKGNRIGYMGANGTYIFTAPPQGWPAKYKRKIELVVYRQVGEKLLDIRYVTK